MIIAKTPLRISLFGGSTDYESFFKHSGSFLIGTTINKYCYQSIRIRPKILSKQSVIIYSKMEMVDSFDEIQNPLIRETLKYRNIPDNIEFFSFSDVPFRTGLGGSSSYCVGMLHLLNKLYNISTDKKTLVREAIHIERQILKEPGGIQDQIWPAYGGFNSIEILPSGEFRVKPMPMTEEFYIELQNSMLLVYTNGQRSQEEIAKSHDGPDKKRILELAHAGYKAFLAEDIPSIGNLIYESWLMKRNISSLISTPTVDEIIDIAMNAGAYGTKLLGSGGCGFVMVLCSPDVKKKLIETFGNAILPFEFESDGASQIYTP